MKKSVYSLVLMDDVVEAIDRLAYARNTSRSNLINQLLAESVSLSTPEMRMRDIFRSMESWVDERFQIMEQPSDSMFSLRTQLKYKYKPTIRYSLELYRNPQDGVGKLKISFRTQNQQLLAAMKDFFCIWNTLELHYLKQYYPNYDGIQTDGIRYIREIQTPANREALENEEMGNAIAAYIGQLDSMIKFYFANIGYPMVQLQSMLEDQYRSFLSAEDTIIL